MKNNNIKEYEFCTIFYNHLTEKNLTREEINDLGKTGVYEYHNKENGDFLILSYFVIGDGEVAPDDNPEYEYNLKHNFQKIKNFIENMFKGIDISEEDMKDLIGAEYGHSFEFPYNNEIIPFCIFLDNLYIDSDPNNSKIVLIVEKNNKLKKITKEDLTKILEQEKGYPAIFRKAIKY